MQQAPPQDRPPDLERGSWFTRHITTFTSLRHRNYRLLWATSMANAAANWIQQITLGWLAYDLTGSALLTGMVFGFRSLPNLVIGPIGGVLSDRFSRKGLLMMISVYLAILAVGFAAMLVLELVSVWHIFLFSALSGVGHAIVAPNRFALVANTVPRHDLMNAIALNALAFNSMRIIGPALGGGLIALSGGAAVNFLLQAVVYVVVVLLLLPLQTPYQEATTRPRNQSMAGSFVEGLRYVRGQPVILALILLAMVPAMFTMPINMGLLPVFAKDVLGAGPEKLGLLFTAMGVGAILGTLTVASLGNFAYKGPLLLIGAVFLGSAMVAYSQVTIMTLAIPLLGIVAFCFTTYSTLNQTILQTVTPDEFRGRVTSLHLMDQGLVPLGSLIAGTVAEFFGASTTVLVFGFATMAFVLLIGGRFSAIRGFRSGT